MFEDLMKEKSRFGAGKLLQEIENGEYKSKQYNQVNINICGWLQRNSLNSLLQTNNS